MAITKLSIGPLHHPRPRGLLPSALTLLPMRTGTTLKCIAAHHGRECFFQCEQCRSVLIAGGREVPLPDLQEFSTERVAHVGGILSEPILRDLDVTASVDRLCSLMAAE